MKWSAGRNGSEHCGKEPMLTRILISIAPLVFLAILCAGFGYCLLRMRHDASTLGRRLKATQEKYALDLGAMKVAIAELAERVHGAEDRAGVLVAPRPLPSGLNLNKRSQAVRMLRRGATADTVATTLTLPLPEVELLLRVQQLAGVDIAFTSQEVR